MTIDSGKSIPSVNIKTVKQGAISEADSRTLLSNGKVLVFGLPGAFTPTCSAAHLPGYVVKADELKAKGVDKIVCMSVNDAFVMKAWAEASNAEAITMLADGNAELTKALGLEMDASAHGMGVRCRRFAMIINDGVVEKVFVEAPGQFEVSSAEHILTQL